LKPLVNEAQSYGSTALRLCRRRKVSGGDAAVMTVRCK